MEKEKITLPIGSNKALIFEADPGNKADMDFARLCKDVAATRPKDLQEFFNRLNDLQQKRPTAVSKKTGRKM